MSTLTQNLHTMLATFYRPLILSSGASAAAAAAGSTHLQSKPSTKRRHKIVYEAKAFPSDQYALASAVLLHGLDPRESLHAIHPRDGEHTLKTEDVIQTLEKLAEEGETALVLLGGIQYFTGQWFEMRKITKRAKELVSFTPGASNDLFPFLTRASSVASVRLCLFTGPHSRMGPSARVRKRPSRLARLGRRFRRLVYLQIRFLRSRWYCRRIRARAMGPDRDAR